MQRAFQTEEWGEGACGVFEAGGKPEGFLGGAANGSLMFVISVCTHMAVINKAKPFFPNMAGQSKTGLSPYVMYFKRCTILQEKHLYFLYC